MDYALTPGQAHDAPQTENLLRGKSGQYVLADRGYDSDAIVACIERSDPPQIESCCSESLRLASLQSRARHRKPVCDTQALPQLGHPL